MKTISVYCVYIAFFCCLFLGSNVSIAIGYPETFMGKYFSNPAVYFIMIAFLLSSLKAFVTSKSEMRSFVWLILACLFSVLVNGAQFPRTTFFPSVMLPCLLSVTLYQLRNQINRTLLKQMFYVYFVAECIIAIIERVHGACFFPEIGFETNFNNSGFDGFRSFSLRGHPLANGAVVSLMTSFILISKCSVLKKNILALLGIISLLCFNARFAIVITCAMYGIFVLKEMKSKHVKAKLKFFYLLLVATFIFVLGYLFMHGWGDRLVNNGLDDDSSGARIVALKLVTDRSITDLFFGYKANVIEQMTYSLDGIGATIENCWIIFLLQYGIIFLVVGVLLYIPMVKKQIRWYPRFESYFIIVPWLFITSSSNSIAGGGITICMLFIMFFAFDDFSVKINR